MVARLLAFLQLDGRQFDEEWGQGWGVMDDSLRFVEDGLHRIGKNIAGAFAEMIDVKFRFDPSTRYIER